MGHGAAGAGSIAAAVATAAAALGHKLAKVLLHGQSVAAIPSAQEEASVAEGSAGATASRAAAVQQAAAAQAQAEAMERGLRLQLLMVMRRRLVMAVVAAVVVRLLVVSTVVATARAAGAAVAGALGGPGDRRLLSVSVAGEAEAGMAAIRAAGSNIAKGVADAGLDRLIVGHELHFEGQLHLLDARLQLLLQGLAQEQGFRQQGRGGAGLRSTASQVARPLSIRSRERCCHALLLFTLAEYSDSSSLSSSVLRSSSMEAKN